MDLTYRDSESGLIRPMNGGLKLTKDKAGRFWIWSEQLGHNMAMRDRSEEEAIKSALSFALFIIGQLEARINALQGFKDRFDAFLDSEGITNENSDN